MGFQTSIDPEKRSLYTGAENTETVPDALYGPLAESGGSLPDHATQLTNAIRLAYCQPYVDAIFNFLLKDERELNDWQSAPMWSDFTPKGSYPALKAAIQDVKADRVNCAQLPGGPVKAFQPKQGVDVEQVVWPRSRSFNWKNDLWRFRVQAGENAWYTATLYRAAVGRATKGAGGGTPVMTTTGELRKLYFVWVTFPRRRLAPGRYVMGIVLRSHESSARNTRLVGPGFQVELPRR
jgi:hypothetical protein